MVFPFKPSILGYPCFWKRPLLLDAAKSFVSPPMTRSGNQTHPPIPHASDQSSKGNKPNVASFFTHLCIWGFIKNPVLSITSSREIGFWEHDIEASKMQGRARGRKGERKTHHITSYHHITMEFGGYSLNVAKNPTRARARKGEAQGVLSYQKVTGIFDNPHMQKKEISFGQWWWIWNP